jgi:DnaJ-class molecular chaperone
MDKTQAARLEHLGLTAHCRRCAGEGSVQYSSYEWEDCDDCRGKGWIITAAGEALIALCNESKVS